MPDRLDRLAPEPRQPAHDDYVWHIVMHRAGARPEKGERLSTLVLSPADVAGYGLRELLAAGQELAAPAEQLRAGLGVLGRTLEAERREWVRRIARAGYVDGWGVAIVAGRGRRRLVFAGIPSLSDKRIVTTGGPSS